MTKLVSLKGNEVFTNSLVISEGTGVAHRRIKDAIKKHKKRFEEFGLLGSYHTESSGGRPEELIKLNEQQATFLITLLKNTEVVVSFKVELVRQFYEMRKFIFERQSQEWQETRQESKRKRLQETDTIKAFVAYAQSQGSHNANNYYKAYTMLANKAAGISNRDEATTIQLNNLYLAENVILNLIVEEMEKGLPYKIIYSNCKARVQQLQSLAYFNSLLVQ